MVQYDAWPNVICGSPLPLLTKAMCAQCDVWAPTTIGIGAQCDVWVPITPENQCEVKPNVIHGQFDVWSNLTCGGLFALKHHMWVPISIDNQFDQFDAQTNVMHGPM